MRPSATASLSATRSTARSRWQVAGPVTRRPRTDARTAGLVDRRAGENLLVGSVNGGEHGPDVLRAEPTQSDSPRCGIRWAWMWLA
jgi:hypothetical protein